MANPTCTHPKSQRIATLGGPGSFTCAACGYSSSTLTERARAVLEELDEGDRVCVTLADLVPWVDLSGKAERLGLIDRACKRTELGREVARLLAEGAPLNSRSSPGTTT